jgi:hypothetical protein
MEVESDLLGYMDGTYLIFIYISYDVLLESYFLDILVHAFCMWMGYIFGHVVDELMKCSWCTPLMIHIFIYS